MNCLRCFLPPEPNKNVTALRSLHWREHLRSLLLVRLCFSSLKKKYITCSQSAFQDQRTSPTSSPSSLPSFPFSYIFNLQKNRVSSTRLSATLFSLCSISRFFDEFFNDGYLQVCSIHHFKEI